MGDEREIDPHPERALACAPFVQETELKSPKKRFPSNRLAVNAPKIPTFVLFLRRMGMHLLWDLFEKCKMIPW